jgi:hypothetical protein
VEVNLTNGTKGSFVIRLLSNAFDVEKSYQDCQVDLIFRTISYLGPKEEKIIS